MVPRARRSYWIHIGANDVEDVEAPTAGLWQSSAAGGRGRRYSRIGLSYFIVLRGDRAVMLNLKRTERKFGTRL